MLKTGRKCTWEEIEVGEVFAYNGCWEIHIKTSKETAVLLTADESFFDDYLFSTFFKFRFNHDKLYKLTKSVQSLWACYK